MKYDHLADLSLIFCPYYSVSFLVLRWSYWDSPQAGIRAEDLDEVFVWSNIVDIWTSIWVSLPLEVVEGGGVGQDQFHMKFKESDNNDKKG